jgi:lipopolysaccharide biosynthesis regulator YciM
MILIIVLVVALALLALIILLERKRKVRLKKSGYIDALYSIIEGDRKKALEYLKEAVKRGEEETGAYILLGNLLRESGEPRKALQIHRSMAVRKDLSYDEKRAIQIAVAEDQAEMGNIDLAIDTLREIKKRKKDLDILYPLHRFYHAKEDFKKASKILKEISDSDDSVGKEVTASYETSISLFYLENNETEKALKYSGYALKENSNYLPALYISGLALHGDGQISKAIDRWVSLLRMDISYFPISRGQYIL